MPPTLARLLGVHSCQCHTPRCTDDAQFLILGYGHIAPVTRAGQVFCMIYGLIGVPLTLLTIADIGMFVNRFVKRVAAWFLKAVDAVTSWRRRRKNRRVARRVSGGIFCAQ